VIAWHLLSTGQPYSDLGADWFLQRHSSEAYRNRLVRQLERMGATRSPWNPPTPPDPSAR
jgi:transposase